MTLPEAPVVSVVIPTYRRDAELRRCLERVLSQDWPPESLQVVVVDDANSDSTDEVVGEAEIAHPAMQVLLLAGNHGGPAAARNAGWRAATGEVIAFIDDDAFPADERWIAEGVSRLMEGESVLVSGSVSVPANDRPTDFQKNVQRLETADFLTCNAFALRSALEEVGGFDERFTAPFREDSDLQYRLEARFGPLRKAPLARVIHPAPEGKLGESLRRQRYSMFNALLYREHRYRYRQEIERGAPMAYYGMVAAAIASAALLASRKRTLAGGALGVWGVLYGRFLARRLKGTSREPLRVLDMAVTSAAIPFLSIYWRLRGAIRFRVWFV